MLDDPLAMADPRAAFTDNPYEECQVELDYRRVSDMFGGEPDGVPASGRARSSPRATTSSSVGRRAPSPSATPTWPIDGYGLRDHSWGPRYWQAPWYYRWLTANFGSDFGFMLSRIARRDSDGTRGGFVWDGERLHLCDDAEVSHRAGPSDEPYHQRDRGRAAGPHRRPTSDADRSSGACTGKVLNLIPLRNRREGLVTRISEGLTEWTLEDGRVGYGLSEYLDQIVEDQPVGLDE